MLSEFLLPVVAYLITLLVLWVTVAVAKAVATRLTLPSAASRPMMIGTRTQ